MGKKNDEKTLLWRLYDKHYCKYSQRDPNQPEMQFAPAKRDFAFERWIGDHPQYVTYVHRGAGSGEGNYVDTNFQLLVAHGNVEMWAKNCVCCGKK